MRVSASVIVTSYSALKWVQDIVGVPHPVSNPFIKTVVQGGKRENAKCEQICEDYAMLKKEVQFSQ